MVDKADADGSGLIEFDEFLILIAEQLTQIGATKKEIGELS